MHRCSVDVNCRGLGIGKKLVKALEDTAKENGYKTMYLETSTRKPDAWKLYEKMGFKFLRYLNLSTEASVFSLSGIFEIFEMFGGVKVAAYSKRLVE